MVHELLIDRECPYEKALYRKFDDCMQRDDLHSYAFDVKVEGECKTKDIADVLMFLRDLFPLASFFEPEEEDGEYGTHVEYMDNGMSRFFLVEELRTGSDCFPGTETVIPKNWLVDPIHFTAENIMGQVARYTSHIVDELALDMAMSPKILGGLLRTTARLAHVSSGKADTDDYPAY